MLSPWFHGCRTMNLDFAMGAPKTKPTLLEELGARCAAGKCDRVEAAAAYVTVSGVNDVLDVVGRDNIADSRWLVGLDDAISQPGAIKMLKAAGAQVRVAAFAAQGARFHIKIFRLSNSGATKSLLVVGSMNLTRAALTRNAETVAFAASQSKADAETLKKAFDEVWALGHEPTKKELDAYAARYGKAAALRKKLDAVTGSASKPPKNILDADEASLDPSQAQTCWIECGAVTMMGRELEIKGEQGLFFGLSRTGGDPAFFDFVVSDGSQVKLRLKFQGNHMWRLQLQPSVPEVAIGLRPTLPDGSLGRSPYVAVFIRTGVAGRYRLKIHADDRGSL